MTRLSFLLPFFLLLGCPTAADDDDSGGGDDDGDPIWWTATEELSYDDGVMDGQNATGHEEVGGQIATCFTPPQTPAALLEVQYYLGDFGSPDRAFGVRAYHADPGGPPSSQLLDAGVTAAGTVGLEWVTVDVTDHAPRVDSGDLCVAMVWLNPPGDAGLQVPYLGMDDSEPDGRTWWLFTETGDWMPAAEVGEHGDRDAMIRVVVGY